MACKIKKNVMKALMAEEIRAIEVIGFDLFLNKGPNRATKPPTIIEIKYFGYLATLEKNSPINLTKRILF